MVVSIVIYSETLNLCMAVTQVSYKASFEFDALVDCPNQVIIESSTQHLLTCWSHHWRGSSWGCNFFIYVELIHGKSLGPPHETLCSVLEDPVLGILLLKVCFLRRLLPPHRSPSWPPGQKGSDGSDASVTLTSDNVTCEPCEDPRTKTGTFSLWGLGMFLLVCTRMWVVHV